MKKKMEGNEGKREKNFEGKKNRRKKIKEKRRCKENGKGKRRWKKDRRENIDERKNKIEEKPQSFRLFFWYRNFELFFPHQGCNFQKNNLTVKNKSSYPYYHIIAKKFFGAM